MSKEFSFPNKGTCSKQTNFVLNDDHTIASIEVIGGCNGNLKGICQLLTGMKAEDAIARLDGTLCGFRSTSCPDQIAKNLKKALEEMNYTHRRAAAQTFVRRLSFVVHGEHPRPLRLCFANPPLPKGEALAKR